jgi:hypothetical protein
MSQLNPVSLGLHLLTLRMCVQFSRLHAPNDCLDLFHAGRTVQETCGDSKSKPPFCVPLNSADVSPPHSLSPVPHIMYVTSHSSPFNLTMYVVQIHACPTWQTSTEMWRPLANKVPTVGRTSAVVISTTGPVTWTRLGNGN